MTTLGPYDFPPRMAVTPLSAKKEQVNLRLTSAARKILSELSMKMGISQADVLEILLREEQKKKTELIERK